MEDEKKERQRKNYFTKENAAAMAKKGAENHRKQVQLVKPLRQLAKEIIACRPQQEIVDQMVAMFPELDPKKISVKTAMLYSQVVKALNGDLMAFKEIRDLIGERPEENVNLNVNDTSSIKERYLELRARLQKEQENESNNP